MLIHHRPVHPFTAVLLALLVALIALADVTNAAPADASAGTGTATTVAPSTTAPRGMDSAAFGALAVGSAAQNELAGATRDPHSPDAIDAGLAAEGRGVPQVGVRNSGRAVAAVAPPSSATAGEARSSDWGDAGLVAGAAVGLALIGLGVAWSTRRTGTTARDRGPVASH